MEEAVDGCPESRAYLVQLIVCVQVWFRDSISQQEHHTKHRDKNAPVSDCEEEVEDNEYVSGHVHHMAKRVNDLTIKDIHVACEDVEDLANRCHIKEDIHRGK